VLLDVRLRRTEPLPLLVSGCLGQEFCYPTASFCEKLSVWLLRGFSCRVLLCLCILDVVEYPLTAMSFLCGFSKAVSHRVESWGEMGRARGSAQDVCICLQSPFLMVQSHLAISCRVQNLHLQFLICQILQSVLTPLHRSEDRAGMPVSFPEEMVSGRPRSGLS